MVTTKEPKFKKGDIVEIKHSTRWFEGLIGEVTGNYVTVDNDNEEVRVMVKPDLMISKLGVIKKCVEAILKDHCGYPAGINTEDEKTRYIINEILPAEGEFCEDDLELAVMEGDK